MKYNNPIIKGFYPDPSICKFNGKYYLVTSSFEYFPGIPIFESTDLVNWEQIGHCLTRKSQLDLTNSPTSSGIFAPTIRTDGKFLYVIATNRTIKKNFIVKTDDPYLNKWSDPIFISNWDGIDPSLFFDNDGKVYIQGNAYKSDEQLGIYEAQIDISNGKLLTPRKLICKGSGGKAPEAPHIFKKDNFYYLSIAEGGTEYGHMVTIFRSKSIFGPYEPCSDNPILTNRSTSNKIQCVGHADIFEDYEHNWWAVCLGIRVSGHHAYYHHLGRETFLAPIKWNFDGWPKVNIDGHLNVEMSGPLRNMQQQNNDLICDFSKLESIPKRFVYLRNPDNTSYKLIKNKGLMLYGANSSLNEVKPITLLGLRQSDFKVKYKVKIYFNKNSTNLRFGLSAFMSKEYHYDLLVDLFLNEISLIARIGNINCKISYLSLSSNNFIELEIDADSDYYYFYFYKNDKKIFMDKLECKFLASEVSATFTGTMLSVFSLSNENAKITVKEINYLEEK
ncbi:glycoside hydrolase family 43 protein [Bombilactobacillus bombi]|uniref:glycoside hydrolase family 43 protein n=1 Tax=Bombilactobacillus bombi TaxID=1303590 RepID=UPI0015E5FF17|nr:glycoside hydrolase family 43 protein [Bombilactobacillus bombi]MBA1434066.1 glycoside hydrolase family 43 protein [Bombilactobacillus bombi]